MSDPKQIHGEAKPQLHLIPPAANEEMAKALELGKKKYTERNWLTNKVNYTTYLSAMKRHIDRIMDGEDIDHESGAHHLGHVMAGCAIVLDAKRHGMLIDDRVLPEKEVRTLRFRFKECGVCNWPGFEGTIEEARESHSAMPSGPSVCECTEGLAIQPIRF